MSKVDSGYHVHIKFHLRSFKRQWRRGDNVKVCWLLVIDLGSLDANDRLGLGDDHPGEVVFIVGPRDGGAV